MIATGAFCYMSVKDSTAFRIVPQKLVRHLTPTERNQNPVLLDVTTKRQARDSVAFQLNVIFQSIGISRGLAVKSRFYIGTTGAEITMTATDAEVLDYTKSSTISVEYGRTEQVEDTTGIRLGPELESKPVKLKVGTVDTKVKETSGSSAKYSADEALLVATVLSDTIRWNIDTHRGQKVVRDFLIGNRFLSATFRWKNNSRVGSIKIRPDIRFFGPDKRPLSPQASLMMRFVLWQRKISLENDADFEFSLSEAA
jgi:hypothetical protein